MAAIGAAHGRVGLSADDVSVAFFVIGASSLLALAFFIPLASNAGAEVSGRRAAVRPPVALIAAAPED